MMCIALIGKILTVSLENIVANSLTTIMSQIVAQEFISFQWFFAPVTKQDWCILVEDSHAVDHL